MSTLLTATLLLFLLWPAYAILLRYSDRYALNRVLLLLAMVAVCTLPFVSLPSPAPVATKSVRGTVSYLEQSVKPNVAIVPADKALYVSHTDGTPYKETQPEVATVNALPLIYGFGVGLLLLVLGVRLLLILALHLRSRLNQDGTYRLLHPGASPGQAFTFGRNLYFSEDVPQDADFRHILDHERVHARQGHTLDILLSELFLCIFWFHPAAWWLRNRMRANLEYLVDKAVVSGGADRRGYQLALVRQSQGAYGLALALPFSEPTLKSRIARMTGLPEYRVVAALAAVALVFWLGVTLLVVNGTVFSDESPVDREYLEASAHPGDPYYEHYQNTLPEELTSLEIYTSRMVTVDEYLQLRAILGKVPGAKLYVFKNRFDEGYSLELRYDNHEPAVANLLNPEPFTKEISILGIETDGGSGQYFPVSITFDTGRAGSEGAWKGGSFNHSKHLNFDSFVLREEVLQEDIGDKIFVYVNRERVNLIKQPNQGLLVGSNFDRVSVKLNGTEISAFGAEDWPKVVVEGRRQPDFGRRLQDLIGLRKINMTNKTFHISRHHSNAGTYRKWYENLDFPKDRSIVAQYNNRKVSLDFLLDTEFGKDAMIQHGAINDVDTWRYALQVIDDIPAPAHTFPRGNKKKLHQGDDPDGKAFTENTGDAKSVNLYFYRLPTPVETQKVNQYLASFPGINFRVFQDCKNEQGDYTFYVGNATGYNACSGVLAVGETYDGPFRIEIERNYFGGPVIKSFPAGPSPANAPASEIYLMVDGIYLTIQADGAEPYTSATLDPAPDDIAIKCKLAGISRGGLPVIGSWANHDFWVHSNVNFPHGTLEDHQNRLVKQGYGDRLQLYYINNRMVTSEEFDAYVGGEDAYVRMGTYVTAGDAPVIMEIVD